MRMVLRAWSWTAALQRPPLRRKRSTVSCRRARGEVRNRLMRAGLFGFWVAAVVTAAAPVSAAMSVIATTTDMAALAAAVGGELVTVESIVPAARGPGGVDARPGGPR